MTMTNTFEPESIIKRTKGKMIMLYAIVDGEETHMASFFHDNKAQFVLNAISAFDGDLDIVDEDAPKKKTGAKKTAAKKAPLKKKKTKK
jgi:hypothetical protein